MFILVSQLCCFPKLDENQIAAHNTFEETEKIKNNFVCYSTCSTMQDSISQQILFQVVAASSIL